MQMIEEKVKAFILQKELIPADGKILAAVSGGADSVALLCILAKLFPNRIHIAHINHQLRSTDSLNDEYYVKLLAEKYKIPVTVELVDVNAYSKKMKLSIETSARELRLSALVRIAEKNNCNLIATAHHKNDNAETVIHRILRGTGYKGLAGIRRKTTYEGKIFVRPLLCLSRAEIEQYLKENDITWQTDYTNTDCRFTRNRIRHKLLPYLLKESPEIVDRLNELAGKCENLIHNIERQSVRAENECVISQTNEQVIINSSKFSNLPRPVQVELIQRILTNLKLGLREYTFEHYTKIINFVLAAQTGKSLSVPGKMKILKGYDKIFIGDSKIKNITQAVILDIDGKTEYENFTIESKILEKPDIKSIKNKDKSVEFFDFAQTKLPIMARPRQKGDKFRPFGQSKLKKIGKFLTTEKIDIAQRNDIFIISDIEKILWVAGARRSNEAKVDANCERILKLTVKTTN